MYGILIMPEGNLQSISFDSDFITYKNIGRLIGSPFRWLRSPKLPFMKLFPILAVSEKHHQHAALNQPAQWLLNWGPLSALENTDEPPPGSEIFGSALLLEWTHDKSDSAVMGLSPDEAASMTKWMRTCFAQKGFV